MENKAFFFILLAALFAALTYGYAILRDLDSPYGDFGNYWLNSKLLQERLNAWDDRGAVQERREALSGDQKIVMSDPPYHSPGFFVFFAPFGLADLRTSAIVWLILGHLALLGALGLFFRRFSLSWEQMLAAVFMVFSFWPLREQVHDGQPNFFILLLLCTALVLIRERKFFWAGLSLGAAIQFREYLVVTVLLFVLKRNWRVLSGIAVGVLLLKLSAAAMFGPAAELSYWQRILFTFGFQAHSTVANLSLPAAVLRVLQDACGTPLARTAGWACGAALAVGAGTRALGSEDLAGSFCLFTILCLLVSPWVHESHFTILIPAVIFGWKGLEVKGGKWMYVLFICAYLLLAVGYSLNSFPFFHRGLPAVLTAGKTAGLILLFLFWMRLLKKDTSYA